MRSAPRLRAPALQPSRELSWVLLRAFAPVSARVPTGVDAARVVSLCRKLDLAPRIAMRHAQTLPAELGAEPARELTFVRLQAVAMDRVLDALLDEVVVTAAQLGQPLVLLKHAALRRGGFVAEGERSARDVDLLVADDFAPELQRALIARNFASASRSAQLHLPPLRRKPGEVVEIHSALWGMHLPRAQTNAEAVDVAGLIARGDVESLGDGCHIPHAPLLAAHAVVHGFVQHRSSPEGYPMMRVIADLCSLAIDGGDAARARAFVLESFANALVGTALRLSNSLSRGVDVNELDPAEFELLGHVVAAGCDEYYRRALRFERVLNLTNFAALRDALHAAEPETLPASTSRDTAFERFSARVERPLSLTLEAIRGAASYAALRLSSRR